MFRQVSISSILLLYLRQFWSFTSAGLLSFAYKFLYACLFCINLPFQQYDIQRRLYNIKARQSWQMGSLMAYLRYYFDESITYQWVEYSGAVWFSQDSTPIEFSEDTVPIPFSAYFGFTQYKQIWFKVPATIYEDAKRLQEFTNELALLCPAGISYFIDEL